ncbi:MAG: hypothetical protein ABJC61_10505 [Acidobacteriota bacterium]
MAENDGRRPGSSGRDALEDEMLEYGVGKSSAREGLETDGPVMGGPGMVRTGADRAVSTGTGGLAAGEDLDPVAEGDYWRENFRRRPYYEAEKEYSDYEPSYQYGWERAGQSEYRNRGFEEVELDLQRGWESSSAEGLPDWEAAREPARDAFERASGRINVRGDDSEKDNSKR